MTGFWTTAERDRWATIRGRIDLMGGDVAALRALCNRGPYHLSAADRDDIETMIRALRRTVDNALPCPDEVKREAA